MSAVVCGKRSSSIFADELLPPSSPPSPHHHHHHHHHPAKRSRCSPHRAFDDAHRREALLHQLFSFFPDMDPQVLEKTLDASGNDLDSAIKSLNDLRLESTEAILSATGCISENGLPAAVYPSVEGIVNNGGVGTATEHPPAADSCQTSNSGSEWVELFVREMTNATDMDDARARASRALEVLEKSIVERAGADAAQNLQKENMVLKEQLTAVLRENAILKRAVAIQHERQKEFDDRTQEVQSLKQLVLQYQEQLRTLEINNYALTMHLKQAQQNNSIPGHYNPDVF
uniref:CUE domain-containing protein n=1 Tax=Leersia perrieri TaxID=77586 RepID=A0A0D9WSH8_9ORYZ